MIPALIQRLFTAFAFVALAGLLAFGGGIRYFCYCAGTAVLTVHEHCHGDHGEEGPHLHGPPGHRHDPIGDSGDDDHGHDDHHHDLVKSATDLRIPEVAAVPELKLQSLPWTAPGARVADRVSAGDADRPRPQVLEDPPPLSLQVARAVVRLI